MEDNARRSTERTPTHDVMHTYPDDYKLIFVGDAAMSPYEIVQRGGSVEHWNEESGRCGCSVCSIPIRTRCGSTAARGRLAALSVSRNGAASDARTDVSTLTLHGLDDAIRELSH